MASRERALGAAGADLQVLFDQKRFTLVLHSPIRTPLALARRAHMRGVVEPGCRYQTRSLPGLPAREKTPHQSPVDPVFGRVSRLARGRTLRKAS